MDFKKDVLYEIHAVTDDDTFSVGYFIASDGENAVFQSINSNGLDNGLELIKLEDIYKLQYNTAYCEAFKKLIELNKIPFPKYEFKGENLIMELLLFAKEKGGIVGIGLKDANNVEMLGFVESVCSRYVTTAEVSCDLVADGNAMARLSDIVCLSVDAVSHLKYKKLVKGQ